MLLLYFDVRCAMYDIALIKTYKFVTVQMLCVRIAISVFASVMHCLIKVIAAMPFDMIQAGAVLPEGYAILLEN